jgi:hypothetical protein
MTRLVARGPAQGDLFAPEAANNACPSPTPLTFSANMSLPVHRWFRYSAGFSSDWVESLLRTDTRAKPRLRVLDPFAGSGTTLLAAENIGAQALGIEAHRFVFRVAKAKLLWRSDPDKYQDKVLDILNTASTLKGDASFYPPLVLNCYSPASLERLDVLRRAYESTRDDSPSSELAWLTLTAILRRVSRAGTAQWQYVLPKKEKKSPQEVFRAFRECAAMIYGDMQGQRNRLAPPPDLRLGDARSCESIGSASIDWVITSPPYPNNFDYADTTRLEMSFFGEIKGWSDLQKTVRQHLVVSCSQHVTENSVDLAQVLSTPELKSIRPDLSQVCEQLSEIRKTKGGKKTYHLMVACYFRDMALTWHALRRVCKSPSKVCFVVGDSAPYGVYVPVVPWLGALARDAGFRSHHFEKSRDRNIKWKNRKHRVPLLEGTLSVEG